MNLNSIIDLYVKYGITSKKNVSMDDINELLEEEMNAGYIALMILDEIAEDRVLPYSLGWTTENIIDDFYYNVEEIIKMSKGTIKLTDLNLKAPLDQNGKIDERQDMSISFTHDEKKYSWSFYLNDNENFIDGFTRWAYLALDGDFLYLNDDITCAYHLPKKLIKELECIGIYNDIHTIPSESEMRKSKDKESRLELYINNFPIVQEGELSEEEAFIRINRLAEINKYSIPSVLKRKAVSNRFVLIKTLEAKVIARTFWHINEIANYISNNYPELCNGQNKILNVVLFDALFESTYTPCIDGTWLSALSGK